MSSSYQLAIILKYQKITCKQDWNWTTRGTTCTCVHKHTVMNQCTQCKPPYGRCTRTWPRKFGTNKTNCAQMDLPHLFKLPEQAPNMSHTDKNKDEDGDLTMEDKDTSNTSFKEASAGMTTRSSSQTTDTTSPVGSATDMVRDTSRHNNYQQMFEDGMAHTFTFACTTCYTNVRRWNDLNYIFACTTCPGTFHTCSTYVHICS